MNFNNFNTYITITNEDLPLENIKCFKVNKIEFQINSPKENFRFQNINNFFLEADCNILKSSKTNKGKNLKQQKLLGFISNISINLKKILEYTLDNSEINVLFYEDYIADNILSSNNINSNVKPYFHLNFGHIYVENKDLLNVSLVYTIYLK